MTAYSGHQQCINTLCYQELRKDIEKAVKSSPYPKILVVEEGTLSILNSLFEHTELFDTNIRSNQIYTAEHQVVFSVNLFIILTI